jgi:structural maintenance of chromosome 4
MTRKSLEDVRESEEEYNEEDSPPPPKKSRPSLEGDNAHDDEEEEEEEVKKPSRVRKAPTRKVSAASNKKGAKAPAKDEEDSSNAVVEVKSESEDDQPPPTKGRRSAKKAVHSSDEEFEDVKPARKARGNSVSRAPGSHATRGRASSAPKSSGRRSTRASVASEEQEGPSIQAPTGIQVAEDGNESDALSYFEADAAPKPSTSSQKKARVATPIAEEPEEEEQSLLESVPPRSPIKAPVQSQPVIPEEPQGPKSRLVIHKMALINFKSYAGRQEIGPFHKVHRSMQPRESNAYICPSPSLLLWDQMAPENLIQSTPCSLCSVTERRRCGKENCPN